jgi:hypothetical protein
VTAKAGQVNDLTALQGVDAFLKMQQWNIDIAIEAPAIKEWVAAARATPRTLGSTGTPKPPRFLT